MAQNFFSKEKNIPGIGKVRPREITEEMRESYIDYAMSVIISRALPDVRDGLKPVQRRILYAMHEMGLKSDAKFRKSATVVGECFVKDTLVLTPKGLIPIQEIKVGDQVYTQSGIRKVIQLYEMPKKPLLKITLENGISNTVTPSQRFKVLTRDWKFVWKKAKDLTIEDYLIIKADYPEINNLVELLRIEKNQPQYLNENIAYLLGILISDGSVSNNDYGRKKHPKLNFGIRDEKEIAEKIISIFKEEFNYTPTIEVRHYQYKSKAGKVLNHKKYQIRISRKNINEFFISNFGLKGLKASPKKIPSKIFQSPSKVIFSFVSGLIDGDGSINLEKNCIRYGSTSKRLIEGLSILLLHQNIFSSKYSQAPKESDYIGEKIVKLRHHKPYSLEIRGKNAVKLAKFLTLASKHKNFRIKEIIKKENIRRDRGFQEDIIPYAGKMVFGELSNNRVEGGWYQDKNGVKFRQGIKHRAGWKIRYSSDLWQRSLRKTQIIDWGIKEKLERIDSPLLEFLNHIIKNKIYFLKVTSVKKVAPQKTYDLEVERDHEFIANGVVSHNCMGKFHPHGDAPIYEAMARMAQDFSLRYPLVEGQGNFGSIDSDPPAAQRYTECRLSSIGEEMLKDIEKETVDFTDNYDGTRKEPVVLPAPLPQLLLNGTMGIAVGVATNIPPHNLSEVCEALIYLLDNPKAETGEIFKFIKGPDFPTGGIICGGKEMIAAYSQGKGKILIRGKAEIIKGKRGRDQIIITEIPFQVSKAGLLEHFAKLVEQKQIDGIKDIRDESDREGMRIVIELKPGSLPQKILNRLFKFTDLQKTFHLNMIALVDGLQPRLLSLVDVLTYFLEHRKEVIRRRTKFELQRAKERTHILEGIHKCLAKIDEVIKIIKGSKDREKAFHNLIKKFKITEIQAKAILEIKLQQLAKLEREKIEKELKEKRKLIKELEALLKSPKKIKEVIREEIKKIQERFGDARRTKVIRGKATEILEEDLIPQEETVIILTQKGFIKRVKPSSYRAQRRGGRGILGAKIGEDDLISHFLLAQTHDLLLFFTDNGKVFQLFSYEIPEGTRLSRGKHIANFINILSEERILNVLPWSREKEPANYLFMVTEQGLVKKTEISEFVNVRKSGLIAIRLKKDDLLKEVEKTSGKDLIILVSKKGKAILFKEKELRAMSRQASGNIGMRLEEKDALIGMGVIESQKLKDKKIYLLTVSEKGFGKRTPIWQYRIQRRGGRGLITAKLTKKTGDLVAAKILTGEEEHLIIISQKGHVIKSKIESVRITSRSAQGVKLIDLARGDKVASLICV